MQGSRTFLRTGIATMLLLPSVGFSGQPDETSIVAATIQQGVLVVRHQVPVVDADGPSAKEAVRDDAVPPSQDASRNVDSTENSVLVIRRKQTETREEKRDDATTSSDRTPQAAAFPVDAVPAAPPAWTSLRMSLYDRTNRAWSLHTNPSWSYHPHTLSYHPTDYQGFRPRRSWAYHPVHRQKYRPKRDWTYHPR